ncbi:multicopper oxidase family protein [Peribacillus frigoritolerans]|uniref:multicopper oxidase family protein n=1 Tax=Peribacillus frigoritolerans TaxID=450367 RepID=UPI0007BF9DFA
MKKWMFFVVIAFSFLITACNNQSSDRNKNKSADTSGATQVSAKEENLEGKKVNELTLTAKESQWELSPKKTVNAWTFNGTVPGQQIRVKQGEAVRITLKNEINEPVSIHWHGIPLSNTEDGIPGVTQDAVLPGEDYTYEFVLDTPGTYWYHSHQNGVEQLDKGLYGTFIVESEDDANYDRDYTLVLDEWQSNPSEMQMGGSSAVDEDKQNTDQKGNTDDMEGMEGMDMNTDENKSMDEKKDFPDKNGSSTLMKMDDMSSYDIFTINGKTNEINEALKVKKGDRVKLRFVNAGYIAHQIHIPVNYKVTHVDGQPINQPNDQGANKILEVAPGERYDIEFVATGEDFTIDCHGTMAAAKDMQIDVDDEAGNNKLTHTTKTEGVTFDNLGKSTSSSRFSLDDKFDVEYSMDLDTDMKSDEMKYTINGKAFPDVPPLKVKKGDKVKVTFKNVSKDDSSHPMHLHGHFFQVLSKNSKLIKGAQIMKDTLNVKAGETYEVAFLADNPGNWLFHCHDLHHASTGMVMVFQYDNFKEFYKATEKVENDPE